MNFKSFLEDDFDLMAEIKRDDFVLIAEIKQTTS